MTRKLLLALALAVSFLQPASAQVMTFLHDGEPAFSLTYPGGWDIRTPRKESKNLVSAMPADGSLLWQGAWVVRDAASTDEAFERLSTMEGHLFRDVKLTEQPMPENIGPLTIRCHQGAGQYKDSEAIQFVVCAFEVPGGRVGALAYMGDPSAMEAHGGELDAIVGSLKVME